MFKKDTTEIYTDRAKDYLKYRPGYPCELIEFIDKELELPSNAVIADIGSGTGIFSKLLLQNNKKVYAIEPNDRMRQMAESMLDRYVGFNSINATAEKTTLMNQSVDMIIVAQAFHWFDPVSAKQEFSRILKPLHYVSLVWNERCVKGNLFLEELEVVLEKFCPEYKTITAYNNTLESVVKSFFLPNPYLKKTFHTYQDLDFEAFKGRILSCSYAPVENDANHKSLIDALFNLYLSHAINEVVRIDYDTQAYFGKL